MAVVTDEERAEAHREANRRWRDRNREFVRAKNRERAARQRQENPEAVRAKERQRSAHRRVELRQASQQRYREAHREELQLKGRERAAIYHAENPWYRALHRWVADHKKRTGVCEICGASPAPIRGRTVGTEWANVSGEYRRDLNDYVELCVPCHRKRDARGWEQRPAS